MPNVLFHFNDSRSNSLSEAQANNLLNLLKPLRRGTPNSAISKAVRVKKVPYYDEYAFFGIEDISTNESGKAHKTDGPAIKYVGGGHDWALNGKTYRTEKEYNWALATQGKESSAESYSPKTTYEVGDILLYNNNHYSELGVVTKVDGKNIVVDFGSRYDTTLPHAQQQAGDPDDRYYGKSTDTRADKVVVPKTKITPVFLRLTPKQVSDLKKANLFWDKAYHGLDSDEQDELGVKSGYILPQSLQDKHDEFWPVDSENLPLAKEVLGFYHAYVVPGSNFDMSLV